MGYSATDSCFELLCACSDWDVNCSEWKCRWMIAKIWWFLIGEDKDKIMNNTGGRDVVRMKWFNLIKHLWDQLGQPVCVQHNHKNWFATNAGLRIQMPSLISVNKLVSSAGTKSQDVVAVYGSSTCYCFKCQCLVSSNFNQSFNKLHQSPIVYDLFAKQQTANHKLPYFYAIFDPAASL